MALVKKDWHEEVMIALELAREAVEKADSQIRTAGAAEMAHGDKKTARLALNYSDMLDEFLFELDKVGDSWQKIRDVIEGDRPEVQEVVLPTRIRNKKVGYKRQVGEMEPWTNFTVQFAGSTLIEAPLAKTVFARALSEFDLTKVAALKCMLNGEPLLSQNKADFKKYPASVAFVRDGWFVSTYCSTATKAQFIRDFAKRFGKTVDVEIIPHKGRKKAAGTTNTEIHVMSKPKPVKAVRDKSGDGRVVEGVPYKVGQVVRACFPEVFKKGLVTPEEVAYLLTDESSKQFKTGGNSVIRLDRGIDDDRIVTAPTGFKKFRYYPPAKASLEFGGKKYYLSSEFSPGALTPVVAWLEGKGLSISRICDLVKKCPHF